MEFPLAGNASVSPPTGKPLPLITDAILTTVDVTSGGTITPIPSYVEPTLSSSKSIASTLAFELDDDELLDTLELLIELEDELATLELKDEELDGAELATLELDKELLLALEATDEELELEDELATLELEGALELDDAAELEGTEELAGLELATLELDEELLLALEATDEELELKDELATLELEGALELEDATELEGTEELAGLELATLELEDVGAVTTEEAEELTTEAVLLDSDELLKAPGVLELASTELATLLTLDELSVLATDDATKLDDADEDTIVALDEL